ncbi:MAG: hypothetical protein U0892_18680 [Pirellulales bacterium]
MLYPSSRGWLPISLAVVSIVCVVALWEATPSALSAGQSGPSSQSIEAKREMAELAVLTRAQEIVVGKAELELLEAKLQAAEHRVEQATANLAAEEISAENTKSLFEKQVVSKKEKELQDAKRDSVKASVSIAKSDSRSAKAAVEVKKAIIALLELRKKESEAALKYSRLEAK